MFVQVQDDWLNFDNIWRIEIVGGANQNLRIHEVGGPSVTYNYADQAAAEAARDEILEAVRQQTFETFIATAVANGLAANQWIMRNIEKPNSPEADQAQAFFDRVVLYANKLVNP